MRSHLLVAFLLLVWLLVGCTSIPVPAVPTPPSESALPTLAAPTATPSPVPTAAPTAEAIVDELIAAVELEPFTSETFGIRGMVPEGWEEIAPGAYNRGAAPDDLVRIIQQAAPRATAEQLTAALTQQLGIEALPEDSETYESASFTWDLYQADVEAPGVGTVKVDLALTETETGAYIVLLQAPPDAYAALHTGVFLPAVEALAPIAEGEPETYVAPGDLFSVPIPTNWTVEEFDDYARLSSPEGEMDVYVLALEADSFEDAVSGAWAIVDPDFDLEPDEVIDEPVTNGADRAVTITYDTGDDGPIVNAGGWMYEGTAYVALLRADLETLQKRVSQLQIISSGFEITALEEEDLTGVEPQPLTDELLAEFEAYVAEKMEQLKVPGAAVAIVQGGELVYTEGFGIRDLDTEEPVTPETRMMIGSTTKSMTTMLMAQLVDEGSMSWDTPVIDILPSFEVADPELTQEITMRNMVCACTGVPRRDFEWLFNASELRAEDVIASLADFEFFTDFGEAFQYSNQMVAAAGYIAAHAAGGEYGNLYDAYLGGMQANVFGPIGMPSTTFSFEEVVASGNYATPYGATLVGETVELPLAYEAVLVPVAPAGSLWSNVLDMAQYLITELNQGVAPDGTRVVSAENLAVTWEPQIEITADASYGLGWTVEDYSGILILSHAGNTFGFSSELAFVPEIDLGISVLTNQRASLLNGVVRTRLLELVFDREPEVESVLEFALERRDQALGELHDSLQDTIDREAVAPYLGAYTHPVLGDITLAWEDDALMLDAGEFKFEIRSRLDDGDVEYLTFTPPVEGIPVEFGEDEAGNPQLVFGIGVVEYTFERVE